MANTMIERLKAEKAKLASKGGGKKDGFLKLPKDDDAEVRVRILPAKNFYSSSEPSLFYAKFGSHWVNGQNIKCPKVTHNKPCPICEFVYGIQDKGDEAEIEAVKDLRVKKRNWVNCVEVDKAGQPTSEPKIFEFGVKLRDNMLAFCVDEDYYDLSDPEKGYTYRIIKTKKDGFPNYDSSKPSTKPTAIAEDTMKALLEKAVDIHQVIDSSVKSYEEIKQIFEMGGAEVPDKQESEDVGGDELIRKINEKLG